MTRHIKQLHLVRKGNISPVTLFSSGGEFPHCPQLTNIILKHCRIDDSVPPAFMKAVQNGELPNLKRIELIDCTVSDCEWPEVPEFSFKTIWRFDFSQMQKVISKLTELDVYHPSGIDLIIPVRLENLAVLKLGSCNIQQINSILAKGKLPNLSELSVTLRNRVRLDNFDPNQIAKIEKLALQQFIISAEELEIISEKLTAIHLTELDLSHSSGFTDSLSLLFTHSFPRLNTLILGYCKLNSNDLQSLARANVEGKLPQLRHLDISDTDLMFVHSAQWNQLTSLVTNDEIVLNVEPEFLISFELILWRSVKKPRSVTRQWPRLKVIEVWFEHIANCIADGVERGMFPALKTIRCGSFDYGRQIIFKLLKANISVEPV